MPTICNWARGHIQNKFHEQKDGNPIEHSVLISRNVSRDK